MPDITLDLSPQDNRLLAIRNTFTELANRLSSLEGGIPTPPSDPTLRNLYGINPGSIADYENRLLRNAVKQAREFSYPDSQSVNYTITTLTATSSRINLTNIAPGIYVFGYLAGAIDAIAASHGTISDLVRKPITGWTTGRLTTTVQQSAMTLTITQIDTSIGFNDFSINRTVATDANGYPLQNADMILWDGVDKAGTYAISYTGAAVVSSILTGTLTDYAYNSETDKSTAKLTVAGGIGDRTISILRFTNVAAGGISDLKIMCPVDIGSTQSYDPNDTKFFDEKTIEKLAIFDGLRLMVTCSTNSNQDVNYSDRIPPEHVTYSINPPGYGFEGKGLPYEYIGQFCKELKAKNPNFKRVWICVPVLFTDAAIVSMIAAVKNGKPSIGLSALDTSIEVVFEYGNELWNDAYGFQHTQWNIKLGEQEITPTGDTAYDFDTNGEYRVLSMRRLAKKSMDIADLLATNLTTHAWFIALQWQQANTNNTGLNILEYLDYNLNARYQTHKGKLIFGGSAYYNPYNTDTNLTADNLWVSNSMDVNNWRPSLAADSSIVAGYSPPTGIIPWDSYEGGTGFETPYAGQDGLSEADALRLRGIIEGANRDSRARDAIVNHHDVRSQYGGGWIFYLTIGGTDRNGPWDFLDSFYVAENTPKMQGIVDLKNANRVAVNQPIRTAPFTIAGNNWQFRSEGFGQGSETGDARIVPTSNYGYVFRINEPGNYRLVVAASANTLKAYLGSDTLATFSGTSPYSVNLPDNLSVGLYCVRLRNIGSSDVFVNNVTVQAR